MVLRQGMEAKCTCLLRVIQGPLCWAYDPMCPFLGTLSRKPNI